MVKDEQEGEMRKAVEGWSGAAPSPAAATGGRAAAARYEWGRHRKVTTSRTVQYDTRTRVSEDPG